MAVNVNLFGLGSPIPISLPDINANDVTPRTKPGMVAWYMDNFGYRWFRYIKNNEASTNHIQGDVLSKSANVALTSITSGTTTQITKTGAGLTASAHLGKFLVCYGASAAAPEGESALITANTATTVNVDPNLPFSAAVPAAANCYIYNPGWFGVASGTADLAANVIGVVAGVNGISFGNWGWVQFEGYCPVTAVTSGAITAGVSVVTTSGAVATVAANASNTVIGFAPATIGASSIGLMPIELRLASLAQLLNG